MVRKLALGIASLCIVITAQAEYPRLAMAAELGAALFTGYKAYDYFKQGTPVIECMRTNMVTTSSSPYGTTTTRESSFTLETPGLGNAVKGCLALYLTYRLGKDLVRRFQAWRQQQPAQQNQ